MNRSSASVTLANPARLDARRRCSRKRSSMNPSRVIDASSFSSLSSLSLDAEDVVRGQAEHAGEGQGKVKARHIPIALDRVDALPRDADGLGQLLLGPAPG